MRQDMEQLRRFTRLCQGGSRDVDLYSSHCLLSGEFMVRRLAAVALLVALAIVPAARAQSVSRDVSRAPSGTYQLDTAHSQVLFSVLHMGMTDYYGRFDRISGGLNFDAHQPERSAVSVTIDMSSVDTPSNELANVLRSASTFDADQYPKATFQSTSVARTGPNTGRMTGNLTIRNITRPVTLDVTFNGGGDNPLGNSYAIGFRATGIIRRSDFGLSSQIWSSFVSDDVRLDIEAMFNHEGN